MSPAAADAVAAAVCLDKMYLQYAAAHVAHIRCRLVTFDQTPVRCSDVRPTTLSVKYVQNIVECENCVFKCGNVMSKINTTEQIVCE